MDAIGDGIEGATTITMDDEIPPVQVVEVVRLGVGRLPGCIDWARDLDTGARVSLRNGPSGCSLSLRRPGVVLLDERASKAVKASASIFDIDSVKSGSLTIEKVQLWQDGGEVVHLPDKALWVTVLLDGRRMLDRVPSTNVKSGLAWELPGLVVDKIARAIEAERAVVVEFEVVLALRDSALLDLPSVLVLSVILDPAFEIDILDAAF